MTELKDKRLEAAAQLHAYIGDRNIEKFRVFYPNNQDFARDVVNFALRVTGADELAEALAACLNFIENTESELGISLSSGDKARAALARYKELKNG